MNRRILILFLLVSLSLTGCFWVRSDNGLTTVDVQGEGGCSRELLVTSEKVTYLVDVGPNQTVVLPLPRGTWQVQAFARDEAGQVIAMSQPLTVQGGRQSIVSPVLAQTVKKTTDVRLEAVRHSWRLDGSIEITWEPLALEVGQLEVWRRGHSSPFWQAVKTLGATESKFESSDPQARDYLYALRYVAPLGDAVFASPLAMSQGSNQGILDVTWEFKHLYPSLPMTFVSSSSLLDDLVSVEPFTELIAHFHTEADYERREEILARLGLELIREMRSLLAVVVKPPKGSERSLEEWSFHQDEFVYLEPNWIVQATALGSQAQMPWYLEYIRLAGAHRTTRGNHNVRIAVLDSGLNPESLPSGVQVLPGYKFVDKDRGTNTQDDYANVFHGTNIAKTIAEAIPFVSIQPVKVLGRTGSGRMEDLSEGLLYAAGLHDTVSNPHPAQIINMSLGVQTDFAPSILAKTIDRIRRETDILLIAASGNSRQGVYHPGVFYPAALPDVVGVGAIERVNPPRRAAYSHYGEGLDLVAPPSFENGTSFATALVSGVTGLMLSQGIPARDVREILTTSAMDIGDPGWDLEHGHGLLNAHWAVLGITETILVITDAQGYSRQEKVPLKGTKERFYLPPGEYRVEAWVNVEGGQTPQVGDYISSFRQITVLEDGQSSLHLILEERTK